MTKKRILLVDDNDDIREVFQEGLQHHGFEVVPAATVCDALRLIANEKFDALLSDLHMPNAGDGFTVVSAMRHMHPEAVTLVLSGYPALKEAIDAILSEADEVLVKPVGVAAIAQIIQTKLSNSAPSSVSKKDSAAAILEREADITIQNWMCLVEKNEELMAIPLNNQARTGPLPLLMRDLVHRLHLTGNATAPVSDAALRHGVLRRTQGYSVAMLVEESRILQVSIFGTLQRNLKSVEFSTVLTDVMTIADEVDSQLKQAMLGFTEASASASAAA